MRRLYLFLAVTFAAVTLQAQTMNIRQGSVTYAIPAESAGDMMFVDGTQLTVGEKTYDLSAVSDITVTSDEVTDNTVVVTYSGDEATVVIAGNLAPYVNATVNGAHVTVEASSSLQSLVTYTLSGSSSDGSFYMDGSYKADFVFNGLTLVNPDSAAVNIQDGKAIGIVLSSGTENALTDGGTEDSTNETDTHKAPLVINGHATWSGSGTMTLTGNVKHGYFSDEYTVFSSGLGTVTVANALSDGFHINEYFQMDGGSVSIISTGDGIDVGAKSSSTETLNGSIVLNSGALAISTAGSAAKGIKCDADLTFGGAAIAVVTTGDGTYETVDGVLDLSSSAAAKCDGAFTMTAGSATLYSTGAGGKGVNATGAVNISGGNLTVVTTGSIYSYSTEDTKPQGVKSDTNITLSGGTILVCASSDSGTAFKTDANVLCNGATVMGIGGKATKPASSSTANFNRYSDVTVTGGSTLSYDGVSFTIPSEYSNSSAKVMVSSSSM